MYCLDGEILSDGSAFELAYTIGDHDVKLTIRDGAQNYTIYTDTDSVRKIASICRKALVELYGG